jgi:murein DD-endopeptidase MepM/ murein hydrolase activator NlpD
MKKFASITLFIVAINTVLISTATAFPRHNPVPGGICILTLAPANTIKPLLHYQGKKIAIVQHQQQWKALIGISLNAKLGAHAITIQHPTFSSTKNCQIKAQKYRSQHIKLKNKSQVNPQGKKLQRILREMKLKKQLKRTFTAKEPQLDFIKPVKGRDNGRFGLKRFFNGQARNPHSGMDIAAATGRNILATATGQVLYTGNLFFSGNVVIIDHGQGLLSLYAHMSKILVQKGQALQQGQVIGKVGKTGRATGPHLHWSVYLNGKAVNPALFL